MTASCSRRISSGLLPERHSGHVLVTSRRRDWPQAETLHLDVLPAPAAAGYLQRRGRMADSGIAAEIADALGCLPLALVQAASVIADGMRAADYLDLLRQQAPKLFAEGHTPDRTMTVATTWRVSVDQLARRSSAALALFRLSAFLAADAVPLARLPATALMPPSSPPPWSTRSSSARPPPPWARFPWPKPLMACCPCTGWSRPSPARSWTLTPRTGPASPWP